VHQMIVILIVKEGGYEQILNKLPSLVSCCRKHNTAISKPGMTACSEKISSLAESLKLFITDDILNEICHHTNAEGSSQGKKSVQKSFFLSWVCALFLVF